MKPIWKFRLLALLIVLFVGGVSVPNLAAELLRPAPLPFPSKTSNAPLPDEVASAKRASTIAPFRSDLRAEYGLALSGQAIKSDGGARSESIEEAENVVRRALMIGSHDSRLWLVLALLQAQSNPVGRLAESLKMSYLTGPNRAELIPIRLDIVTSSNALSDPDLNDLARSDVRAILTQFPDQRGALVNDYARASGTGKRFLEDSVGTIDPGFVDKLRGTK